VHVATLIFYCFHVRYSCSTLCNDYRIVFTCMQLWTMNVQYTWSSEGCSSPCSSLAPAHPSYSIKKKKKKMAQLNEWIYFHESTQNFGLEIWNYNPTFYTWSSELVVENKLSECMLSDHMSLRTWSNLSLFHQFLTWAHVLACPTMLCMVAVGILSAHAVQFSGQAAAIISFWVRTSYSSTCMNKARWGLSFLSKITNLNILEQLVYGRCQNSLLRLVGLSKLTSHRCGRDCSKRSRNEVI